MICLKESKSLRIGVLALALCTAVLSIELRAPAAPLERANTEPISIDEIRDRGIQGKLGRPLGKAVTIDGVVFDEHTLPGLKDPRIWLEVQRVDGVPLKEPRQFEFDLEEFYPHGIDIDDDNWAPIMPKSHGDRFKYMAYETGGFTGWPVPLIENFEVPIMAGKKVWYFETHLVIVRDLAKANESP